MYSYGFWPKKYMTKEEKIYLHLTCTKKSLASLKIPIPPPPHPPPHHFSNGPSPSKRLGSLYVFGKLPTYPSPKPAL